MATFSLLGGVPIIAEMPAEAQRANAALGMAQGNAAANNFLKFRESALEQRRWEEGEEMRQQQVQGMALENEGRRIRNRLDTLGKLEGLEQMGRMGDAWAKTKEWEAGGWGPEQKKDFYGYIERNPSLATTPWYEQQVQNFNFSERHRRAKELLDEENKSRERIAAMRSAPDQPPGKPVFYTDPDTGKRYFYSGNVWNEVGEKMSEVDAAELSARLKAISDSPTINPDKKAEAINAVISDFRMRAEAKRAPKKVPMTREQIASAVNKWTEIKIPEQKPQGEDRPKSKYRIEEVQ